MAPRPMTDHLIDLIADRFKALSEPARLRLLDVLRDGEMTVGELVDELGSSHANTSKHLQVLFNAGFLKRRKQGLNVFYRLADKSVFRLCDIMCGRVEAETHARRASLTRSDGRRR